MQEKAPRYLAYSLYRTQHAYPEYSSRNVRAKSVVGVNPTNQLREATQPLFKPKRRHLANLRNAEEAGPWGYRVSTITASYVDSKLTDQPREAISRSSTLNVPPDGKSTTIQEPKLCPCPKTYFPKSHPNSSPNDNPDGNPNPTPNPHPTPAPTPRQPKPQPEPSPNDNFNPNPNDNPTPTQAQAQTPTSSEPKP